MIKTTGAEFSRFYSDASMWPEGAWQEFKALASDVCTMIDSPPSEAAHDIGEKP